MENFATLRMGTLKAERNAVTDNVDDGGESQRVAARRAMEWQKKLTEGLPSGAERVMFPGGPHATGPVRELRWNPSDDAPLDIDPILTDEDLEAISGGAKDAEPTVLSFYAGRPFSEGRKAHNQYRISRGLLPISEGKK
jgi:hypothetical protein